MAFKIGKTLHLSEGPFGIKRLDETILNKTEALVRQEKQNNSLRLFSVNYKEVKASKPGYRSFHIIEAYNERDKD